MESVLIGNAKLYLGDCSEVLAGMIDKVDAVVTDPPYGIGESSAKVASRQRRVGSSSRAVADQRDYGHFDWDQCAVDEDLISRVRTFGTWAVIFGGNYYALPASKCWLVWDKENGDNDFADCELAWTNLPKAVRRIRYLWNGMLRANGEQRGDHPTQKPIGVMEWAINHIPEPNNIILDPFMGSGTTGVACMNLGRSFIGIEREPKYFDIACRRIEDAQRQARMFG